MAEAVPTGRGGRWSLREQQVDDRHRNGPSRRRKSRAPYHQCSDEYAPYQRHRNAEEYPELIEGAQWATRCVAHQKAGGKGETRGHRTRHCRPAYPVAPPPSLRQEDSQYVRCRRDEPNQPLVRLLRLKHRRRLCARWGRPRRLGAADGCVQPVAVGIAASCRFLKRWYQPHPFSRFQKLRQLVVVGSGLPTLSRAVSEPRCQEAFERAAIETKQQRRAMRIVPDRIALEQPPSHDRPSIWRIQAAERGTQVGLRRGRQAAGKLGPALRADNVPTCRRERPPQARVGDNCIRTARQGLQLLVQPGACFRNWLSQLERSCSSIRLACNCAVLSTGQPTDHQRCAERNSLHQPETSHVYDGQCLQPRIERLRT